MNWLKHAFSLDGPGSEPTAEESQLIDRLCREIVRRRLTVPALVVLEVSRPLNTLGAQALHFFSPLLAMFSPPASPDEAPRTNAAHQLMAAFLERPGSIEKLCDRLEAIEKEPTPASGPPENAPVATPADSR